MNQNIYIILVITIALIYYGIFKLKEKKNRFSRIIVLTIAGLGFVITILNKLIGNTILYTIILFGGLFILFTELTIGMWKLRKVPEKKLAVNIYFGGMGIAILCIIYICIILN